MWYNSNNLKGKMFCCAVWKVKMFFIQTYKAISLVGRLPFGIHYVFSCNEAMERSLVDWPFLPPVNCVVSPSLYVSVFLSRHWTILLTGMLVVLHDKCFVLIVISQWGLEENKKIDRMKNPREASLPPPMGLICININVYLYTHYRPSVISCLKCSYFEVVALLF
jgi:hypothetical protein